VPAHGFRIFLSRPWRWERLLARTNVSWIIVGVSAVEVIEQIKRLSPDERAQVMRFVIENEAPVALGKAVVAVADDGLPVIRTNGGVITSRLVRELESLTP
jgi:hypothetical protein